MAFPEYVSLYHESCPAHMRTPLLPCCAVIAYLERQACAEVIFWWAQEAMHGSGLSEEQIVAIAELLRQRLASWAPLEKRE